MQSDKLKKFTTTYGHPKRVIPDRGTVYTSESFQQYCRNNGIEHNLMSVRHPRANGQVERTNSTIIDLLMTNNVVENQWDKNLDEMEFHMNCAINKTTGMTPFKTLMEYTPTLNDSLLSSLTVGDQSRQEPKSMGHNSYANSSCS